MIKDNKFYVLGGGWISSAGYGQTGSKPRFSHESPDLIFPELEKYLNELPPRIGRFDSYTKACFSAAVLALNDAGLLQRNAQENFGIVAGSRSGVYDNDISFFESARDELGAFSSPNLFSYTLPNVALGEIAVFFNFTGPSFCTGNGPDHPGRDALASSLSLLKSGDCAKVLTGWAETAKNMKNKEKFPGGAQFAVLSLDKNSAAKAEFSFDKTADFSEFFG